MEDNNFSKITQSIKIVAGTIILLNIYWFCHSTIMKWGYSFNVMNDFLLRINNSTQFFETPNTSILAAIGLLILGLVGEKPKKDRNANLINVSAYAITAIVSFVLAPFFLKCGLLSIYLYSLCLIIGYIATSGTKYRIKKILKTDLMNDRFNEDNESFMQETNKLESDVSINLPTTFFYKGKKNKGWINVVNPYRATMVLGTPGSGKSFAVVNNYIKQQINKGFAMYVYDFKFPTLSEIVYNHYRLNPNGYKVKPKVYVINFDDPSRSHRCNPINPKFMTDISDAYESAYMVMVGLNKTWVQKQGDFFVESPINLMTAIIWYFKMLDNGKYCTLPHVLEFLNRKYEDTFEILRSYTDLANYLQPFINAWEGGAQDQLQGQIASAQIATGRLISPQLYWVMTGDDFSLDLNNPEEPKILCVGNNPDRQTIYSAALGLYNSRIVKIINKPNKLKSSIIIDELPTIYFRGLDNLIATARSNKVAVCLGFQDMSQLTRDYGDKEAKVIANTIGNIFSGQVVSDTAKNLSERFGKVLQERQSISINKNDTSTSISTQMDSLIPASKISSLSQGRFVGAVVDDFGKEIKQKIFNCSIDVDLDKLKAEEARYEKIPIITDFFSSGENKMDDIVRANYIRIKDEVDEIISRETGRIRGS